MKPEIEQVTEKPKIPTSDGTKIIYVAGKYRGKTDYEKTENIWHAVRVSVRLWELGWVAICPHANTAHFDCYSNLPPQTYLNGDLEILKRCDAIFMLKGFRQSIGAMEEYKLAQKLNLEIFYEGDPLDK